MATARVCVCAPVLVRFPWRTGDVGYKKRRPRPTITTSINTQFLTVMAHLWRNLASLNELTYSPRARVNWNSEKYE